MATFDVPPRDARRRRHVWMAALSVFALVLLGRLLLDSVATHRDAATNAEAANRLCRQVVSLGQSCATHPPPVAGVTGAALAPAPVTSVAPTDENGVPQAYQPAPDALIVAVTLDAGHLVLTWSDGARVDAGPASDQISVILHAPPGTPTPPAATPRPPTPTPTAPTASTSPTVTPTAPFQPPTDLESETTP